MIVAQHRTFLVLCFYALNTLTLTTCIPNLRIKVNQEIPQTPPYLIEAIKQIEVAEHIASGKEHSSEIRSIVPIKDQSEALIADGANKAKSSVVKAEAIEEMLDLGAESVLRLSPESIIGSVSAMDYTRASNVVASAPFEIDSKLTHSEDNKQAGELVLEMSDSVNTRKSHLPVTNSHLKKPAGSIDDEDTSIIKPTNSKSEVSKSEVAPSIAVDGTSNPFEKKALQSSTELKWGQPIGQMISDNASATAVPGILNKEYASQNRTRVTLGGGFIRDRLPPLVNPASSSYHDDRPEKPVVPLERPHLNPASGPTEVSRVIEVPERILIPIGPSQLGNNRLNNSTNINKNRSPIKPDSRCPKVGTTTFEHHKACDKYFYCEDGYLIEKTCPNGLMYGTRDIVKDHCVHRWTAVCEEKTIPNPISSPGCRWQYGIFNVQGSPKCSPDFYECTDGKFEVKKCSIDGQVYDDRTKSCKFAELVGCADEALADFSCPPDDQANTYWPFPRYFLNERALIHCINDKPQIVRCTEGERVDPEHLHCVPIAKQFNGSDAPPSDRRKAREKAKSQL